MPLYIVLLLLLLATAIMLSRPFLTSKGLTSGGSKDVYEAQLQELERERTAGLISNDDAKFARIEIQRRLLSSNDSIADLEVFPMTTVDRWTLAAILSPVLIGASILYVTLGQPDVQSVTHKRSPNIIAGLQSTEVNAIANQRVDSVDSMIEKLQARLEENPNDAEGWRMLGWSKFRTDDFQGAAIAYGEATKLDPDDGVSQSAYAESLIRSQNGFVSEAALAALQKAVAIDGDDARARFLIGLHKQQIGDVDGSLNDWLDLLNSADPETEWYGEVRTRIVELSESTGTDISDRLPANKPAAAIALPTAERVTGPTPQQIEAANSMEADDRAAMIESMVAGLDARLQQNPDDLEGWIRLIRSYRVLDQTARSQQAFRRSSDIFAKDQVALVRLREAFEASAP